VSGMHSNLLICKTQEKADNSRFDRLISIGFSGPKVTLNRLPGWEPDSWAYHGDDGMTFCSTQSGKAYGPKYSTLDVIGCGVNFRTGEAFFTKNGVHLGKYNPQFISESLQTEA
jgi:hypothetical protein